MQRQQRPHMACAVITALLVSLAGCFVTTDENLWRQRQEAGVDSSAADGKTSADGAADGRADASTTDAPLDLPLTDATVNCKVDKDCDDNAACTSESCSAGKCVYTVVAGSCFIAKVCYSSGASSSANTCLRCVPSTSALTWTVANGSSCDDSIDCTHGDVCAAGVCQGTAYSCNDNLSCTTDSCTGTGPAPAGCTSKLAAGNCLIGGVCRASGVLNTKAPCQVCTPSSSTSSWSALSKCVSTLAGSVVGFANGPAASARFDNPYGVATDAAGKVYVADQHNHRIRMISAGQVTTLAGSGISGYVNGAAASARFNDPRGVLAVGSSVYVSDTENHRVRRITAGTVSLLAGSGVAGTTDGPAATARFNQPKGLAMDSAGKIYVADYASNRIRVISGGQVSTLAGGSAGNVDGSLAVARFDHPRDLIVDSAGKIYVADTGNHKIRLISGGQVSTVAGTGTAGATNGSVATARFNSPYSVDVGAGGKIYVADTKNHKLRLIAGGQVSTLAGTGGAGLVDGPAASAKFNQPNGVACHSSGKVYVADHLNNVIRLYTP